MRAATRTLAALVALVVPSTAAAHEPWVTEFNDGVLVNVGAWDVTTGKDGNLWFTESLGTFGRITPSAVLTDFPDALLGGGPRGIATGADGNLWFAESGGNGAITRVTPAGEATEFSAGLTPGDPVGRREGPGRQHLVCEPQPGGDRQGHPRGRHHRVHRRAHLAQRAERDHRGSRRQPLVHRDRQRPHRPDHDGRRDHRVHVRAVWQRTSPPTSWRGPTARSGSRSAPTPVGSDASRSPER